MKTLRPGAPRRPRSYGQAPRVAIWEVTQACDLKCAHCRAEARPWRHPLELTAAEGRALLERIAGFGDPPPTTVLSGGDPLKRPDLLELLAHGTGLGLPMAVTPAPTASLDRETVRSIRDSGARRIALSLDGATPERHDRFRGAAASFAAVLAAAEHARELGLSLQINTTVTRGTAMDLPAMADLAGRLGAAMWEVFFLVPIGRGSALEPLSPEETEKVLRWLYLRARRAAFRVITVEAPFYRRVGRQLELAGRARQPRRPWRPGSRRAPEGTTGDGKGIVFVSHTGEVYPSGFLPLSGGNVRKDDLVELYRESPLFRRLREPQRLKGKCGRCEFRFVCGGSRARAYAVTGDPLESDPLCPYVP